MIAEGAEFLRPILVHSGFRGKVDHMKYSPSLRHSGTQALARSASLVAIAAALFSSAAHASQTQPITYLSDLVGAGLGDGDYLVVATSTTLVVDMSPSTTPHLGGVFVSGLLVFSPTSQVPDVELRTAWMIVGTTHKFCGRTPNGNWQFENPQRKNSDSDAYPMHGKWRFRHRSC